MFTLEHCIFLTLTIILTIVAIFLIFKFKPSFNLIFTIACILCVISETAKTFSSIEFDWVNHYNKETGDFIAKELVPFIKMEHFPIHLCSLQIANIFIVRFTKPGNRVRDALLGFMFPTMIFGAILALLLPDTVDPFNVRTYQYFIYHGMLVVLGVYIMFNKNLNIRPIHYLTSMAILFALGLVSIYANSLFAQINVLSDGTFDIQYMPNLMFTMGSPVLSLFVFEKPHHWYIYLGCVAVIAFVVFALFYIPIFIRSKKQKVIN